MEKLVLLLMLIFTFGCSPDDGKTTFLEDYNGTAWFTSNGEEGLNYFESYKRFRNNLNEPIEYWDYHVNEDCYSYYTINFRELLEVSGRGTITITVNSDDIFEYRYQYESTIVGTGLTRIERYTVSGNDMQFLVIHIWNGSYFEDSVVHFTKSSDEVDNFISCSD